MIEKPHPCFFDFQRHYEIRRWRDRRLKQALEMDVAAVNNLRDLGEQYSSRRFVNFFFFFFTN